MKKVINMLALGVALAATGCQDEEKQPIIQESCAAKRVIKEAVLSQGLVIYDRQSYQYTIHTPANSAFEAPAVGVICGQLPEAFRKDSLKVSFSGTYTEFDAYAPPAGSSDYYYLLLTTLEPITGE